MNPFNNTAVNQAMAAVNNNVGNHVAAFPEARTEIRLNVTDQQKRFLEEWIRRNRDFERKWAVQQRFRQIGEAYWGIQHLPRDQQLQLLQEIQQMMVGQIDQELQRVQVDLVQAQQTCFELAGELHLAFHYESYNKLRVDHLEMAWWEQSQQVERAKKHWFLKCEDRRKCMGYTVLQFESKMLYWFGLPRPMAPNVPIVPQPGAQSHALAPVQPNDTVNPVLRQTFRPYYPYPLIHPADVQQNHIPNPVAPLPPSQAQLAYSSHLPLIQPRIPDLPPIISNQAPDWFNQPGFNLIPAHEQEYALTTGFAWFNMPPVLPNSTEPLNPSTNSDNPSANSTENSNQGKEHELIDLDRFVLANLFPDIPETSNQSDSSVGQAPDLLPGEMDHGDEPEENGNNGG